MTALQIASPTPLVPMGPPEIAGNGSKIALSELGKVDARTGVRDGDGQIVPTPATAATTTVPSRAGCDVPRSRGGS